MLWIAELVQNNRSEKRSKKALGTLQKDMEIDLKQYINSTHSLQC